MLDFQGVFAYPPTPMDTSGEKVDLHALTRVVDHVAEAGVHGIIPLGSIGEFAYLDGDERRDVAEATVRAVDGRVKVLIGVSAITTRDAVAFARHAEEVGADGLMLSLPTYYPLDARQVVAHVSAVADSTPLSLLLYNNPYTSAVDLTEDILADLVELPTVVAVKEASKDINRVSVLVRQFGDQVTVLGGGFDPYALPAFAVGAKGWTTGMASLVPRHCVDLHHAAVVDRDWGRAQTLNDQLAPLADLLCNNNLSAAVKCGLSILGLPAGAPRRPLAPVDDDVAKAMAAALEELGLR